MTTGNETNVDRVLAQTGWVRRFAKRLVSDEYVAEDLAQEAQLAALRDGPGGNLRPWLTTVLRNLALKWRRSEAIRNHYERKAAPQTDSEEDGVRKVWLQRALADAILELAEPHRTAVIQRYFDGLDYAELARRHRVSEAAARKRVSRAVAQLKKTIEKRDDGHRITACLASFGAGLRIDPILRYLFQCPI